MAQEENQDRFEGIAIDGYERSGSSGKVDVLDEFIPELRGRRGRRTIRQMVDNDDAIGAVRFALNSFFRGVQAFVDAPPDTEGDEQAEYYRQWLEDTLFSDLGNPDDPYTSLTWDDFIINMLTAFDFGWSYFDVPVYTKGDGTIGVADLKSVAQETLDGWKLNDKGQVTGLFQRPPVGVPYGGNRYIDKTRALHFVADPNKGSPEGKSALRHIYTTYYYKSKFRAIEAILMERGCGFPVLYIDESIKRAADAGNSNAQSVVKWAPDFVANIKRNSQSGAVLYTSPYKNVSDDGSISHTTMRTMELKLETPGQSNSVDIDRAIKRSDASITRGMLASFLMMGTDGRSGSLALGEDSSNLFLMAIKGWLEMMYTVINRQLVPMLWELNGFPEEYMPYVRPGELTSKTINQVSGYVKDLAAAGIMLTDTDTEDHLRELGGLPKRGIDSDLPPIPMDD